MRHCIRKFSASIIILALLSTSIRSQPIDQRESDQHAETISLLGQPLYPPPLPASVWKDYEQRRLDALAQHNLFPEDPDKIIWLGRRTAYLGRYREAIETYTRGIQAHPKNPRLYRHRGHRYITVREFDRAISDLETAAASAKEMPDEIEQDGLPNRFNIPTSTMQSNIWYHLGLAYYLKGDFANAVRCYKECLRYSTNDDMKCATTDWLYMSYRRLEDDASAHNTLVDIRVDMKILENTAYHRRLLMYKGELPVDSLLSNNDSDPVTVATYGYGVGNWYFYNGEMASAVTVLRRVLNGSNWAAFGYIAAEADLARLEQ